MAENSGRGQRSWWARATRRNAALKSIMRNNIMRGPNTLNNQATKPPDESSESDDDVENVKGKENADPNIPGATGFSRGRAFGEALSHTNADNAQDKMEEDGHDNDDDDGTEDDEDAELEVSEAFVPWQLSEKPREVSLLGSTVGNYDNDMVKIKDKTKREEDIVDDEENLTEEGAEEEPEVISSGLLGIFGSMNPELQEKARRQLARVQEAKVKGPKDRPEVKFYDTYDVPQTKALAGTIKDAPSLTDRADNIVREVLTEAGIGTDCAVNGFSGDIAQPMCGKCGECKKLKQLLARKDSAPNGEIGMIELPENGNDEEDELTKQEEEARKTFENSHTPAIAELMVTLKRKRLLLFADRMTVDRMIETSDPKFHDVRLRLLDATARYMARHGHEAKKDFDAVVKALKVMLPDLLPGWEMPRECKHILPNFKRKERFIVIVKMYIEMFEFYITLFRDIQVELEKLVPHNSDAEVVVKRSPWEEEAHQEVIALKSAILLLTSKVMEIFMFLEERGCKLSIERDLYRFFLDRMDHPPGLCVREDCMWRTMPGGLTDRHPFRLNAETGCIETWMRIPILDNTGIKQVLNSCPNDDKDVSKGFCAYCFLWRDYEPKIACPKVAKFAVFSCELCKVMIEGGRRVWLHIWTHKHMEAAKQAMRDKVKLPEAKMNYAGPQACYDKKPKNRLFCKPCEKLIPKKERIPHMNTNDHLVNNMKNFLRVLLDMAEERPTELGYNFCQFAPTRRDLEPSAETKLMLDDVVMNKAKDGHGHNPWSALERASRNHHSSKFDVPPGGGKKKP